MAQNDITLDVGKTPEDGKIHIKGYTLMTDKESLDDPDKIERVWIKLPTGNRARFIRVTDWGSK